MLIRPGQSTERPWWLPLGVALGLLAIVAVALSRWTGNEPVTEAPRPGAANSPAGEPAAELQRGRELAQRACQSCHLFPEPQILDRVTWAMEILPAMRIRLGMSDVNYEEYPGGARLKAAKVFPESPAMTLEEWRALCNYYLATAPLQTAPQGARAAIQKTLPQFEVVTPAIRHPAATTLVKIDETTRRIYVGDADAKTLEQYDASGKRLAAIPVESPPVSVAFKTNGICLTLIGSYTPSDELQGKVSLLRGGSSGIEKIDLLSHLPRPAHTVFADLNGDGREDMIVSTYGNLLGHFSWYENQGEGKHIQHVLLDRPGALRSEVYDFNKDGRPDIIVMMAAGREGIYQFLNDGNGRFTAITVAEEHPAWGNSYFELVDFNQDGFIDILATNGDNGESGRNIPPLKNYHGVRLYLNDGKNHFREAFFYPLNGAYRAVARDFNGDGRMDIAAISFFPDYHGSPEESFVYLENAGGLEFKAYSFPECLNGAWLTMDAGDVDGDGDPDIVLGAYDHGPYYIPHDLFERWQKSGPAFLVLRNKLK